MAFVGEGGHVPTSFLVADDRVGRWRAVGEGKLMQTVEWLEVGLIVVEEEEEEEGEREEEVREDGFWTSYLFSGLPGNERTESTVDAANRGLGDACGERCEVDRRTEEHTAWQSRQWRCSDDVFCSRDSRRTKMIRPELLARHGRMGRWWMRTFGCVETRRLHHPQAVSIPALRKSQRKEEPDIDGKEKTGHGDEEQIKRSGSSIGVSSRVIWIPSSATYFFFLGRRRMATLATRGHRIGGGGVHPKKRQYTDDDVPRQSIPCASPAGLKKQILIRTVADANSKLLSRMQACGPGGSMPLRGGVPGNTQDRKEAPNS
ncbi:uncharacterized protein EI97DRAFT_502545 [Westerdykella ornata]|uniref:Uncharacterized protein n=1 Tax=Westerdykella ornata TaxID=318751 RepID=A0A6A6JHJ7_WESOR|nr:uncharacterized protein EI97DRAFT_502545 [Westerdykella ornata]KAF2274719.1 hypothetical protein EI97DRAFT_502545 [Westerdykella ornata]